MRFACFGGAAAVADEAVAVARHRRGKLFSSNRADKSPSRSKASSSSHTKRIMSPGRRQMDYDICDMIAAGKSSSSSSALSTAASLDSAYSSSSSLSSSRSSSRSSSSSSLSSLDATPTQSARKRVQQMDQHKGSPWAGAAAVLVCLVMMTFGGRLAATLLTAAVLCFFPRRWPASPCSLPRGVPSSSPESVGASRRYQAETISAKAVTDGLLVRNRNKF